jgi:hypothetical protein
VSALAVGAVAPPPAETAAVVASDPPTASPHPASPHSATGSLIIRFSRADAQRAVHSVTRRVAQCRHGRFWGSGYATVVFRDDGRVQQVLVDPPFSMTIAGKCVADALRSTHMHSFIGRNGYYRFRFYIAPR